MFFVGFFILLTASANAQTTGQAAATELQSSEPVVRPRDAEESSSFIGDPDPLDPLPVKKENLKDDEEPVLEDIRQILNAPIKKKTNVNKKKTNVKKKQAAKKSDVATERKLKKKKVSKKTELIEDEPDLKLEKKLNQIYKKFNSQPTPEEMWSTKTADRDAETYVVQKGDTLSSISQTLFGDPTFWPKIWSLNLDQIKNPHFIYPGAKISFFPGTEQDTPTLAVEAKTSSEKSRADTNTSKEMIEKEPNYVPVADIPDSLPLYRNDNYFLEPKLLEVDLKKLPEVADDFSSDILLSEKEIVSAVKLEQDQMIKGYCGGEHLLHVSLKNSDGDLNIYETLETLDTDAGDIFSYRLVGKAKILNSNRIKINECVDVISRDLVFIYPSEVDQYRSNQISKIETPTLIGGPGGLGTQKLFSNQQKAYVNMGAQQAEIGQIFSIKSQLTEKQSGQVRVIDKFGSFAIVVVTKTEDLLEAGDQLYLPQSN